MQNTIWLRSKSLKQALMALALCQGMGFATLCAEELPRVAKVNSQPPDNKQIIRAVRQLVEDQHISHPKFNDQTSTRGFELFLKAVDPTKAYLLQSDVDEFKKSEYSLDDMLKKNDISFAYTVYKRYLERLNEVSPIIHEQIDAVHDFTVDESIVADPKETVYCRDAAERNDRWRKTIKLNILSQRADGKKDDEIREILHRRYRTTYKIRSQMDTYELLELYLTSLTTSLDPHTTYMAPREQANFNMHLKLELKGIGATLRPDDGQTVVETIVPGGAADKDGRIKIGDKIVAVAQEDGKPPVETQDMKLDDVVSMIRGDEGTKVILHVQPKAGGDTQIYQITRALIRLEDSAAQGEVIQRGQKADGSSYKFGFIKLPSFYLDMDGARQNKPNYRSTTRDLRALLKTFKESKIDAVILDLSKNGGGSLTEAINTTGLFIESGPVVQVKEQDGTVQAYNDEDRSIVWDGPLIVKISQLSASASEIFAGAIQDYGRGIIVGDPKTHGKGTVQTLLDLGPLLFGSLATKEYGALKLTIQQFYLPDGRSTQLEGVSSDVILPSLTAQFDISEGDLEYPLPMDKVRAQPHKNYRMVDSSMKVALQQASTDRVTKNSEFEKLLSRIDVYLRQKNEKSVSLKETEYMARRKDLSSEKEEEEQIESKADKEKIFNPTFYNEEILNIAKDYVDSLQRGNKLMARDAANR